MSEQTFRQPDAWRLAMELTETIYRLAGRLPNSEQYGLSNQIRRAAVSVPSNIAEGHGTRMLERQRHHLRLALGSLAELSTQIELACRLGFLAQRDGEGAEKELVRVTQVTTGLLTSVTRRIQAGRTSVGAIALIVLLW